MIAKILRKLSLILFFSFSLAYAQSSSPTYTYELVFPAYEMMKIKPLVALTQVFFGTPVEVNDNNYEVFIYHSTEVVSEAQIREALEGTEYELLDFNVSEE
ncbi:MAG: hypothetical protein H6579_04780 [Chitinophagales bacterium]|nr:hypothetical protein [Chitinophagales bacterium]